ncbi:hypothetical protein AAG570_000684 [Ranatra chinensis]|uniref:Uncharacterized protein n=1 Tax=Ranatra chinensis TaxID=642074 RepID=A0ABD0YXT3_9HEMI
MASKHRNLFYDKQETGFDGNRYAQFAILLFVDFQESHFNTFGWDLTYFFHMSMSLSDMGSGQDCLIRAYRMSLLETFEKFDFAPENTPTVEDIEDELDRLLLFGFAIAAAFLPVVMDVDVGLAAEDVLDDSEASAAKRMAVYSNEKFTEVIKPMLEKCLKLGKL